MNYLFTLCGRAGSQGFKNKNLKSFLGYPLVYYSLAAIALYTENFGQDDNIQVVLNTDSEELIKVVTAQTAVPVFIIRREESLGGDTVPKIDVIKDCLQRTGAEFGTTFDMVIDLDITSPLRTVNDVKNAIDKKLSRTDTSVVYSVTTSRRNPYFNMVKQENGFYVKAIKSDYTARQQAPEMYDMNASIYAYSPQALREKPAIGFFNGGSDAIMMKDTAVLDIDDEEDFELMQIIAGYLFEKDGQFALLQQRVIQMLNK